MNDQTGLQPATDSDYDVSRLKDLLTRPGCLYWFLGLLLVAGILVVILFVTFGSDTPRPIDAGPTTASTSSALPAAGCEDASPAFRASGGSELVQRVCWEPTGQLRAEAGLAADAEPGSPPMRSLCTALSTFVAGSGRDWKGFTVYSTHRLSPGRAILTSSQPGQCGRPAAQ